MSSLTAIEKRRLEQLFGMSSGYVLDFSDRTFGEFFVDTAGIDIHASSGGSKANKLRQFWRNNPDSLVGKVVLALVDWRCESNTDDCWELADQCREIAQRLLSAGPNLSALKETATVLDAGHLAEEIRRIEQSIEPDPALAIGTAKELLETCCKAILAQRGKSVDGTPELSDLTKAVFRELKLLPENIPDQAKGGKTIKVLLSNLATIGQGLAELRGLYGTGHGKHGRAKGLTPRHARLAVGAMNTVATFLFETHKEIA